MHEAFMAQRIVEQLVRLAAPYAPCRLTRVVLKVGPLQQAVPDLLRFAVQVAARGTPAESARIDIEPTLVRARCNGCGESFAVHQWNYHCPACDSPDVRTEGGDELVIQTITIEQDSAEEQNASGPSPDVTCVPEAGC